MSKRPPHNCDTLPLTSNERCNHSVKIVKETDEEEAELDEALLLMLRKCPEDFCCIEEVVVA